MAVITTAKVTVYQTHRYRFIGIAISSFHMVFIAGWCINTTDPWKMQMWSAKVYLYADLYVKMKILWQLSVK